MQCISGPGKPDNDKLRIQYFMKKNNDHVHSSQKLELPKLPKSFLIICSMGNIERKQVLMNPKWTSVVNSKQVSSITGLNVQNWNVLAWLTSQD